MDIQEGISKVTQKDFWTRPEGTMGKIVAAAAIAAAGYGFYLALPTLIKLMENTLYFGALCGAAVVLTSPIWNTRVRTLCSYLFKSTMRAVTGWFIELDPIGIIKGYVAELHKRQEKMVAQIGKLRGATVRLEEAIDKNAKEAKQTLARASAARDMKDMMTFNVNARQSERLTAANKDLAELLSRMHKLYTTLNRIKMATETKIADTENQVRVEEMKYASIQSASSAFNSAISILRGGEGKELYDQSMEYLAENFAMKIGEIENFMTESEGMLASIDLDNLMHEKEALAKLESLELNLERLESGEPVKQKQQEDQEVVSLFRAR